MNDFNVLSQEECDVVKENVDKLAPEVKDRAKELLKEENKAREDRKAKKPISHFSDVLLKDELDALLVAINSSYDDYDDTPRHSPDTRRYRIYDFKRPDKFSRNQIRSLSDIHSNFARHCTTTLSSFLRNMTHIHLASVDQLTYEEFLRSVPTPTTLGIIDMSTPLVGHTIIEIDPAITFSIIDRLAGGSGDGLKAQHELTDIEQGLMEEVIVRLLGCMREAWFEHVDLRPRLASIETNPQFCTICSPTEMVVLATLEAKIGDIEGMINVCLPAFVLESVLDKLEHQWPEHVKQGQHIDESKLFDVAVNVRAELGRTEITVGNLRRLAVESKIYFEQFDLRVFVDNTCIGKGLILNNRLEIVETCNYRVREYMDEKNNIVPQIGGLDGVKVQIIVELGRTEATIASLTSPTFGEGSILELNKQVGEAVDVYANNVMIAKGEVICADDVFGIRITDVLKEQRNDGESEE